MAAFAVSPTRLHAVVRHANGAGYTLLLEMGPDVVSLHGLHLNDVEELARQINAEIADRRTDAAAHGEDVRHEEPAAELPG
jgi:hypothetical protein